MQGGPLVHVIAAKAVCFAEAMKPEFVEYQKQVLANAQALADGLAEAGFRVVSGGTDTHLMLVDVFAKGIRGKEAETALDKALHHRQQEHHSVRRQPAAESRAASGWAARPSPRAASAKRRCARSPP